VNSLQLVHYRNRLAASGRQLQRLIDNTKKKAKVHNPARAMKAVLVVLFCIATAVAQGQIVTNTIDAFVNGQSRQILDGTTSSTVVAAGAIGGYRTMTLTAANPDEFGNNTQLSVSPSLNLLSLATPSGATANFTIKWGGLGGTNGLGGVDLIAGNSTPDQSNLKFNLKEADFSSSFSWTFTDTLAQTASYTGTFPVEPSSAPDLAFSIALSNFTGAINWNSINFITFSGGGVANLDLVLSAPITMETTVMAPVPEPGTWAAAALLAGVAGYIHWRRRRVAA